MSVLTQFQRLKCGCIGKLEEQYADYCWVKIVSICRECYDAGRVFPCTTDVKYSSMENLPYHEAEALGLTFRH